MSKESGHLFLIETIKQHFEINKTPGHQDIYQLINDLPSSKILHAEIDQNLDYKLLGKKLGSISEDFINI